MPRNVPALEAKAAVAELMSHDWKLRLPQKNVMSIAGGSISVMLPSPHLPAPHNSKSTGTFPPYGEIDINIQGPPGTSREPRDVVRLVKSTVIRRRFQLIGM